ncbi:ANTAR domain-containing protein [Streptomyces sp. H51]|uniref:ANTAR domain-containing protein n=1 Tax=Streptomyces sp. H51 TaxID=3111770 RepID=UPI002D799BDC|nr:ANTAR domain-containing protein [Streptomyces sp. H51]
MTSAARTPLAGRLNTLVIDARVEAGRARLAPRGELVQGCADTLAATLGGLPAGIDRIDLDMSGVVFMDTAGLRFLDHLGAYGDRHRVTVRTAHWNGQPRRILELAGLDAEAPLRSAAHRTDPAPSPPAASPPAASPPAASAVALERAERLDQLREEVGQLRHAIASRPVIDQARGVLMATHSCTAQEAWDILREASQLSNTKLRAVAAAVTAGAEGDGPPPPPALRRALHTAAAHRLS